MSEARSGPMPIAGAAPASVASQQPGGSMAVDAETGGGLLRKRLRTLAAAREQAGLGGAAYLLWQRLDLDWSHADWFVVFAEDHGPDPDGLPFRWAGPDDAALLAAFGNAPEVVRARLAAGDRCAYVAEDGRLMAYVWYALERPYDENGLVFHLGADQTWVYDAEVGPPFRGRRLFPRLRRAAGADLAREGVTRAISTVDRLNAASLRGSAKTGRAVATVVKLRVGPLGVAVIRDAAGIRPIAFWRRRHMAIPERWSRPGG